MILLILNLGFNVFSKYKIKSDKNSENTSGLSLADIIRVSVHCIPHDQEGLLNSFAILLYDFLADSVVISVATDLFQFGCNRKEALSLKTFMFSDEEEN